MSKLRPSVDDRDHLRGRLDAPVSLTEFGDFQCPFCGQAYPVVKALENALGENLVVSFRHFPIVGSHPNAMIAAEAAEAAGAQGRFWDMHDMLYEHQDSLEVRDLERHAALLGLDLPRFMSDVRSHASANKIRADLHSGAISGVNGTPTFFVNGFRHDGSHDFESLYAALTDAEAGAGLIV